MDDDQSETTFSNPAARLGLIAVALLGSAVILYAVLTQQVGSPF